MQAVGCIGVLAFGIVTLAGILIVVRAMEWFWAVLH